MNLEAPEYRELQGLARKHKVSMAWLGRRAIEQFLQQQHNGQMEFPFPDNERSPDS